MTKPVTISNTFATQSGNVPASQIDADLSALAAAVNDPATYTNYAVDTGGANAYVITLNPAPSTQASLVGVPITFKAVNANTTASTLNINGLGIVNIKHNDGTALNSGEIPANSMVVALYDGTNYQIQNPSTSLVNLVGGQIKFPSTQIPSADVNTLDDYEEGTWTPSLGGTTTYYTQQGTYTKIGNRVFVEGTIYVNAIGTGSTTTVLGLPFTSAATPSGSHYYPGAVAFSSVLATAVVSVEAMVIPNVSYIQFLARTVASITSGIIALFQSSTQISFSVSYRV
jgi:hypothetical protein